MSSSSDAELKLPPPKRTRWRRWLKWTLVLIVVVIGCVALAVKDHVRTLASLRHVPNTNLYVMDYYGRYHMDEIRRHGVDVNNIEDNFLAAFFPDFTLPIARALKEAYVPGSIHTVPDANADHCTTAVARTRRGDVVLGRNLDWKHNACLILKIHAREGGASSVAVIDLAYLNLDRADLEETGLLDRFPLLFAPYFVGDGMNQYGVAVSGMSVSGVGAARDANKPDIICSSAMRLILDYAHSTDEAISILKDYNVYFVETTGHLLIADAEGDSAVVEFIDGDVKVTRPDEPWQVCTNHRIWGRTEEENDARCSRYRIVSDRLAELGSATTFPDVMDSMASASVENWTMWTSVYDLSTGEFRVAYRRKFADVYADKLTAP